MDRTTDTIFLSPLLRLINKIAAYPHFYNVAGYAAQAMKEKLKTLKRTFLFLEWNLHPKVRAFS